MIILSILIIRQTETLLDQRDCQGIYLPCLGPRQMGYMCYFLHYLLYDFSFFCAVSRNNDPYKPFNQEINIKPLEFERENYFRHIIISMSGDGGVSINNYLHPEVLKW
jgi:hypothetical protein